MEYSYETACLQNMVGEQNETKFSNLLVSIYIKF